MRNTIAFRYLFLWGLLFTVWPSSTSYGQVSMVVERRVLSADNLKILLRAAHHLANDMAIGFFCGLKDKGFWGDVDCGAGDMEVTTNKLHHELKERRVRFVFDWYVIDLFDNVPPFDDCNCRVVVAGDMRWEVRGGQLVIQQMPVGATELKKFVCEACPAHTVVGSLLAGLKAFGEALGGKKPLPGKKASLASEISRQIEVQKTAIGTIPKVIKATIRLQDLWIGRDKSLMARFEFKVSSN